MSAIPQYDLRNGALSATVIPFGASLTSLCFQDQELLRRIPLEAYPQSSGHFGSIAGPIANRVGGGEVEIDGIHYTLPKNEGNNTLHGGPLGLGRQNWTVEAYDTSSVSFTLKLADRELGLPGERVFRCHYQLLSESKRSSLVIRLSMNSSAATMCNLAPHPYFCLDDSGSILDHELMIFAERYLPTNERGLPTGEVSLVEGSRFDLREPTLLSLYHDREGLNFDHNFCLKRTSESETFMKAAQLYSRRSRILMEIHTNQAGLQVYTPSMIGEAPLGDLSSRHIYEAICLEPQSWPDGPNHKSFPSVYVGQGEVYEHLTRFDLSRS